MRDTINAPVTLLYREPSLAPVQFGIGAPRHQQAANDNSSNHHDAYILAEALRFFAAEGISAGQKAHDRARTAFFAGDSNQYRHWSEICAVMDRRLAKRVSKNTSDRIKVTAPLTRE